MRIAHNNVGNCLENLPQSEKNLMFFFSTSVACIINRTLRKHNTNEVKDSGIFLQTNIILFIRVMRLLSEMMYKIVEKRLQYIFANLL